MRSDHVVQNAEGSQIILSLRTLVFLRLHHGLPRVIFTVEGDMDGQQIAKTLPPAHMSPNGLVHGAVTSLRL